MSNPKCIERRYGSFPALVLCLALLSGCGLIWRSANLPNGYKLQEFSRDQIRLIGPDGRLIYSHNVNQFMIVRGFVYGDLGQMPIKYFCLDTSTGVAREFETRNELDMFSNKNQLPIYQMYLSYTFWDLTSGKKRWQDDNWPKGSSNGPSPAH